MHTVDQGDVKMTNYDKLLELTNYYNLYNDEYNDKLTKSIRENSNYNYTCPNNKNKNINIIEKVEEEEKQEEEV